MARFLLRKLSAGDSDAMTERLFQDDSLLTKMEEVERDLLDAYASGRLSDAERRDVDVCLMTSDAQHEKLRLAFALRGNREAHRREARGPAGPLMWAAATVVLVMLGSAAWIARLSNDNQHLRSELATLSKDRAQAEDAPAVAFLLMPVDRSSAEQHLEISPGVTLVRLNLALEPGTGSTADIRVTTASGSLLLEQHKVAVQEVAGAAYLSIWVPGAALPAGSYSVSVTEDGGHELDYRFRLIHHK
jgi:hypothetical protein